MLFVEFVLTKKENGTYSIRRCYEECPDDEINVHKHYPEEVEELLRDKYHIVQINYRKKEPIINAKFQL